MFEQLITPHCFAKQTVQPEELHDVLLQVLLFQIVVFEENAAVARTT
jgi:hypothetical protein